MSITTFSVLAATPNAQTDFLAIITPKKRLQNWTKTGGATNVYEVAWANIFQASTDFGNTYRLTSSVEHDETALTAQTSIANVDANAGSYWHDTANNKLYIHTTDSSNPNSVNTYIVVFFNLYFSSGIGKNGKGKIFSDIYYEPFFSAKNIPAITYEQTNLLAGGGMQTGSATFEFFNHKSFWDKMWTEFSWKNADFKLYFGGEDLPFSEYQLIYMGSIREEDWEERSVSFEVVNYIDLLKRIMPVTPVFGTNVADKDTGKPLPLCFGDVHGISPLLTNDSVADANEYTIADAAFQTLKAIDNVYDGVTDVTANVTKDLTNCKFTFVSYTPTGAITCDVQGAKISDILGESDTDLMTNASDIIRFFLLDILGVASSKINAASFATAKTSNTFALAKYIRYRRNMSSYIADIERSVLGNLFINNDGEFQFDIYEPTVSEDDTLENEEMARFKQRSPLLNIFEGIKVYYNPTPFDRVETSGIAEGEEDTELVVEGTNKRARYLDEQKAAFKHIHTWIKTLADATVHKDRLLLLTDAPVIELDVTAKGIKLFQRKPGDILKVSRTKAATTTGAMLEQGFQIIRIIKEVANNQAILLLDNMKGLGLYVGRWTSDTAPNYTTATEAQKLQQGFWSDANGFCDPTDYESYKKSIWW